MSFKGIVITFAIVVVGVLVAGWAGSQIAKFTSPKK